MRVLCWDVSCLRVVGEAVDINLPSRESLYMEGPEIPTENIQAVHMGAKEPGGQLKKWLSSESTCCSSQMTQAGIP